MNVPLYIQKALQITTSFPSQEGKLFFTFDDGPTPGVTELVLDILDLFQAKATFFCLGKQVERHPELVAEILKRGHAIGNHGYLHLNGLQTPHSKYCNNLTKAKSLIKSNLFRPPYGKLGPLQYFNLRKNYRIILWDVMAYDFSEKMSASQCSQRIILSAKSGSILVFHDTEKAKKNLLPSLESSLLHFQKKNFTFEKITDSLWDTTL